MALVGVRQVGIKATGSATSIPNDDWAKLSYYLSCLSGILPGFDLPAKLIDFAHYRSFTSEDQRAILVLSLLLSPDEFAGKIIFPLPDGHQMLNGSGNEFYEISESTRFVAATEEVIVGGQRVRVAKIMVCSMAWLEKNFINPFKNKAYILEQIKREKEREEQRERDRQRQAEQQRQQQIAAERQRQAEAERQRKAEAERQRQRQAEQQRQRQVEAERRQKQAAPMPDGGIVAQLPPPPPYEATPSLTPYMPPPNPYALYQPPPPPGFVQYATPYATYTGPVASPYHSQPAPLQPLQFSQPVVVQHQRVVKEDACCTIM